MSGSEHQHALEIWQAAVAAVDSQRLVQEHLHVTNDSLLVAGQSLALADLNHIEVVGAGKAGAGMARGVEQALSALPDSVSWSGWMNVPEDCVASLDRIHLHGARPAGVNEPTVAGVAGSEEILSRVSRLGPRDLCLVLISGGGSALLPAPEDGISLRDKQTITRQLAAAGATIQELNTVRSRLSRIKAGGLAAACSAGKLITLVISDVIGDPLDVIASGPTFVAPSNTSEEARQVLQRYDPRQSWVPPKVLDLIEQDTAAVRVSSEVSHHIIGSNRVALTAAAERATQLGYAVTDLGSANDGLAEELGRSLYARLQLLRETADRTRRPQCLLAGGETTVTLCDPSTRGRGGRNQQLVLSAVANHSAVADWDRITLLSGGTDGEDGPTPAAGAWAHTEVLARLQPLSLEPRDALARNDAWTFFDQLDALIMTGPTHTNVMDVQVGLALPTHR